MQAILDWVGGAHGSGAIHEAWREFSLWDEETPSLDLATPHRQLFLPWFIHAWSPGAMTDTEIPNPELHGIQPTAMFLKQRAEHIDLPQRRYLEACLGTPFSFHEIKSMDTGNGFAISDLLNGSTCNGCHQPHQYPAQLMPTDIIFGQCVQLDGVGQFEACSPLAIPRQYKREIIERCRSLSSSRNKPGGQYDLKLRAIYFDIAGTLLASELVEPELPSRLIDPVSA